ncbi:MAG: hypothetical protein FP820_07745 [Sulfurimonas sp.]|jgi:hypothetical protein|nr:hypothetical protein [Sulfurimonas sp.]MBU1216262.1 hypothetical protein [bacterium]MBU1434568.1 hypothetical protein [bacterium]MBU1502146.1 hypothetical protein [bacterium]MBU3938928.1 hypothetical protein [bacterium]
MTFEQQWLEYDYNPFILFNTNGKINSLNAEAQFLLGFASMHELFELATSCASVNFGFKTTFMELEFGRYKFFGLTVGYENEEQIGIKLYQSPVFKITNPKTADGELTNIYTLIDLCISTNSISSKIHFVKDFDPTIPSIVLNSNKIIKILNKMYDCFKENEEILTRVFYRIGEHIKFENKKYSIFSIEINAKNMNKNKLTELKNFVEESGYYIEVQNGITINIPMITSKEI